MRAQPNRKGRKIIKSSRSQEGDVRGKAKQKEEERMSRVKETWKEKIQRKVKRMKKK